jgi:hypothetical protein
MGWSRARQIAEVLGLRHDRGARYARIGGLAAAAAPGMPRATHDVELLLRAADLCARHPRRLAAGTVAYTVAWMRPTIFGAVNGWMS